MAFPEKAASVHCGHNPYTIEYLWTKKDIFEEIIALLLVNVRFRA
jgi:hypothetical protein